MDHGIIVMFPEAVVTTYYYKVEIATEFTLIYDTSILLASGCVKLHVQNSASDIQVLCYEFCSQRLTSTQKKQLRRARPAVVHVFVMLIFFV